MSNSPYSRLDRALHNIAFGSTVLQDLLEDVEASIFANSWKDFPAKKPVFITSLPRAGTTIILETLHRLPGLATHTYRNMPFILSPVLWSKLSRGIRKETKTHERAHGDGLVINEDSPEAFEETLWIKFFPEHYSDNGIRLWESANEVFTNYFHQHMQKIVSLHQPQDHDCRYLSKNNCNIARITTIKEMFPDSFIIVPLRHPLEHAISLWRQHNNFLDQQSHDRFVQKYMADIGHYEFGLLHRPINFPEFGTLTAGLHPKSLNYWIAYWISAFEYLSLIGDITFMSYEELCKSPTRSLENICQKIELTTETDKIAGAASIINSKPPDRRQDYTFDTGLTERAYHLHKKLLSQCAHNN
jgi:hypothetical protein